MASGNRRRQTLSQGLDKEVYQVIRKLIDERMQYGDDSDIRLKSATVYDTIKASNSSLNRKPKNLLQDSIERVLETIQQDSLSSEGENNPIFNQQPETRVTPSNGLNKSIVGAWATTASKNSSKSDLPTDTPSPSKPKTTEANPSSKHRLANGEPPSKKRKPTTSSTLPMESSPSLNVNLADLGGVDQILEQFQNLLVLPMKCPQLYLRDGIDPPTGILICGPSGCGKTTIAHALAAQLQVNFMPVSAPTIVSGMSGESEKALRDLFDQAKRSAPTLIFIDEIDAITPKRDNAQREMEKRIVAQLLTCMDNLSLDKTDLKPVIVLAATSRPETMDPSLRRSGRFDKEILMPVPSEAAREQIIRSLTRQSRLPADFNYAWLAKHTPGFVGADLKSLVSAAGRIAIDRCIKTLQAQADESVMALDDNQASDSQSLSVVAPSPAVLAFSRFNQYIQEIADTLSKESVDGSIPDTGSLPSSLSMAATFADYVEALPKVQPSAMREGFATIPSTTFASIGALQSHIDELDETIIQPILHPEFFAALGITPSSGVLLWGPPGCGKTLLAKACANSSHANFISVKGPELLNKYVGESERAVRQVFTRARSSVPVILFLDELDALVPRRDGASSEASARVVNTLLTELDGVGESRAGIYVVAATNRPDMIDSAMLRPGRLDTKLYVGLPDAEGRVDILRTLCRKLSGFIFTEDMADLARTCVGFSGADMENLVKRAGHAAYRRLRPQGPVDNVLDPVTDAVPMTLTIQDFLAARPEVGRSVSQEDTDKFEELRRQWGKASR
ncbi:hypothetical protein B0A52_03804 [Exophiala mesophila]|uniref:AAA+ ATPase domain-containing protein n=1 Tax=Exophiala mesophila TaxID=212818 RepID=A0A438N773_EXOME|nr:hypothetical protein B0A52_03804 [Exophiala mesophila]